ncbi:ABC transporter, ATP-binding protein [Streptococcus sp. DD12]|nr:ABC transporter, ATP-binding protein [Streptococcus sp. DD12]
MLEVKELVKRFGDKEVLHGLSFQASAGHIVGIIGKNGSGKTTLFHSILRFLRFEGEILFEGQPIRQSLYSRIGYLPEERSLMPKWTVLEQVQYLAQLKGLSASQVKKDLPEWMERLAVKGRMTDKIKSLSKGNQQKIQLIITLIHQPDLIILDEPFSGLDPVNTALLKEVILAEKQRGALILFFRPCDDQCPRNL